MATATLEELQKEILTLQDQVLVTQTINIALAAIVSSLHETAHLSTDIVAALTGQLCEMDENTEVAVREFAASIIGIAKDMHQDHD